MTTTWGKTLAEQAAEANRVHTVLYVGGPWDGEVKDAEAPGTPQQHVTVAIEGQQPAMYLREQFAMLGRTGYIYVETVYRREHPEWQRDVMESMLSERAHALLTP